MAEIRLFGADRNLQIIPSESRAVLYLDASETKGRNSLTIEISGAHYAVLKQWIERYRNDLADSVGAHPENRYLFPANGLTNRHLSLMNQKFREHNERLGFTMNLHLARHVTAKIALDRGLDIATVSQLLGHKSIKTTERYYAECIELFAQREYHKALIETKIGSIVARAA